LPVRNAKGNAEFQGHGNAMGQPMVADVSWDNPNKLIWRALADPVEQPIRRQNPRHPIFLNRLFIQPLAFQENPLKNVAASVAISWL
jgi:hypothetical protein